MADDSAMLRWYVNRVCEAKDPKGNVGANQLQAIIRAWLVGLDIEVDLALKKSVEWLDIAIQEGEDFGESKPFHSIKLHWARAIGKWMLYGLNESEEWFNAMRAEKEFWSELAPHSSDRIVKNLLDDYMAFSIQAARYTEGIKTYEKFIGINNINVAKLRKPQEYGYTVCWNAANFAFEEEELLEAGRRMLRENLEQNWLAAGDSLRAATWLKIVYWDQRSSDDGIHALTPLQIILKAYENMPKVSVPEFIKK